MHAILCVVDFVEKMKLVCVHDLQVFMGSRCCAGCASFWPDVNGGYAEQADDQLAGAQGSMSAVGIQRPRPLDDCRKEAGCIDSRAPHVHAGAMMEIFNSVPP